MKHERKKLLLLTIIIAGFVSSIFAIKSFAQTPLNYDVTVSPVFFDLSSNPGGEISEKIRIRNNTSSPIPIKLEVKKLTGDVNGDLTLRNTSDDNSLSWISFANGSTLVAKPLEWTDVPFTINIPKSAAYGYYFAISFTADSNSPFAKTGARITGAAAVPILLNVRKEGAKAEAKIVDFSTNLPVYEYLPVDFNVTLENTGNIHVLPHGNIFLSDGSNKDLAALSVNPNAGNIIPNTKRTFNVSWSDGFIVKEPVIEGGQVKLDKNGNPVESIQINWDKLTSFRIGKYTANLILVFDNGTKDVSLQSTISFWVFPWKALLVILLITIGIILVIRFVLKAYINRELKKRQTK